MTDSGSRATVLVTGASGFIAMHCILRLFEKGYRVRGTVRSPEREEQLRANLAHHAEPRHRLDVVQADLTRDQGWTDAVAGCRYVLHVASPFPSQPPAHEDDLIRPAREGTLRVLRAAADAGAQRVVMTSSVAAVIYGVDRSKVFDESDWSNIHGRGIGAYEKSKTIAERAAWDWAQGPGAESGTELAVINPGLVLGPLLSAGCGTSAEVVKKLMQRDIPACPDMCWPPVDVRDVAAAHIAAMELPEAAGQRFICAIETASMCEVARILDEHLRARGFRIPTRKLPNFVVRLVAIFDRTARLGLNDLGRPRVLSNARIRRVLGWEPRSLREMVVAMADSLIEYEVVSVP